MKKLFLFITAFVLGLSLVNFPAYAAGDEALGEENAIILKDCAKSKDGVMCILELVVDIMSIGIGILGVIAISVVGIQYLTAGDSEEKARKAKRRIFEIVIGLAVYAVAYAVLKFLLPNFK